MITVNPSMSTKFTMSTQPTPEPARQLGLLLMSGQQWVMTSLLRLMEERGHVNLNASHLTFLSNLDCGDTYASAVARRMGVSRQAVYRSTRELQRLNILKLETDETRKTQKIIRMTKLGQKIVMDARACLSKIETTLSERIGERALTTLAANLSKDWGPPLGGE